MSAPRTIKVKGLEFTESDTGPFYTRGPVWLWRNTATNPPGRPWSMKILFGDHPAVFIAHGATPEEALHRLRTDVQTFADAIGLHFYPPIFKIESIEFIKAGQ